MTKSITHQPPTLTQTRTTRKNKLHKTRIQDSTDDHSSVENKTKLHSYQFSSTDLESNNSYKLQQLKSKTILPRTNSNLSSSITSFRSNKKEESVLSTNEEIKVDTSFNQDNLK